MNLFSSIIAFIRAKPYLLAIPVVAAGGAAFFMLRGDDATSGTFVVVRKDLVQQVSLSGRVTAAQEADLGFSSGGRVSRVYVKVGDQVGVGRLLAETENGDLWANVLQRQAALAREEAKLASLEAGTRPEQLAVTQAAFDNAALALLDALRDAYTDAENAVRNTTDPFFSNPNTTPQLAFLVTDSQLKTDVEARRAALQSVLANWQSATSGLSAVSDVTAAAALSQQNLALVSAYLGAVNAALNRAVTSGSVTQATLDGYVADVSGARTSLNAAASSLTAAMTAYDAAKKNLALQAAGSTAADIAAQKAQVDAAKADVVSAQAAFAKTRIVAPFSGIVTAIDAKVGQVAASNAASVSLINKGAFQIESFVPEVHVALLELGDKATVALDAYGPDVPFEAALISIDPAETVRDGVSTYRAILQFPKDDPRIRAGMTATVVVTTEEKKNVLSVPQGAIHIHDDGKYAHVVAGDDVVERKVTTGSVSSLGEVEIVSGVAEGDVIALPSAE